MESKGILKSVTKDWVSGKFHVTFEIEQDISDSVKNMQDKPLRITAKQWKEKRSLDANAYYWVLVTKLAEALHISKPRCHNLMLRRYGQNLTIDGKGAYIPHTRHRKSRGNGSGGGYIPYPANLSGGIRERRDQLPDICYAPRIERV